MSESGKALLLIAIVVCLALMVQPDCIAALTRRQSPVPKRVLSEAEMQLFTTTANTGEIVMVGTQGLLLDQGSQAVRVGTSAVDVIVAGSTKLAVKNGSIIANVDSDANPNSLKCFTVSASGQDKQCTYFGVKDTGTNSTSYSWISSSRYGEGYNKLCLQPDGGNVGIGAFPQNTLHIHNNTSYCSTAPDGDYQSGQLLITNTKTGTSANSSRYSLAIGMDQAFGIGYLNVAGNNSTQPLCLNTRGGGVGIGTTNPSGTFHVSSDSSASASLYVGKSITANNDYKNSYFIRPNTYIDDYRGRPSTSNWGGDVLLHSAHLYHNSWDAWNSGGAVRIVAGSVYSRGNTGNTNVGHELGGDILIDSGAVVKRNDGGAGPYARGGCIIFRTGNVYNVSSESAVNTYPIDYTTRMFIHGQTGYVGIGTNSPDYKLHLYGNGDFDGSNALCIRNASSGTNSWSSFLMQNDGPNSFTIFLNSSTRTVDGGPNTATVRNDKGALRLQSKGGYGLYVREDNGYVSIGSNNVEELLHVGLGGHSSLKVKAGGGYPFPYCTQIHGNPEVNATVLNISSAHTAVSDRNLLWVQNPNTTNYFQVRNDGYTHATWFGAGSKNFDIQHPLHPQDENKRLVHSCVEGPRNDLLYRGTVQLVNGRAVVNIDRDSTLNRMSEGTFEALCRDPVFYLQAKNSFDRVIGEIVGATLTIVSENPASTAIINWMVIAERKDKTILDSKMTDENGNLITEYTK